MNFFDQGFWIRNVLQHLRANHHVEVPARQRNLLTTGYDIHQRRRPPKIQSYIASYSVTKQYSVGLDPPANVEHIKRFTVLGEEWLPDSDLLTPTSKLKRRGILARYAAEIDAMYD